MLINHSSHPTEEPRYEYCILRGPWGWTLLYSTLNGKLLLRRLA
jgi:hypothetical protein